MHTTTVRFAEDTWRQLKQAAEREGIPAAQYIREATIGRLAVGAHRAELDALEARVAVLERLARVRHERR